MEHGAAEQPAGSMRTDLFPGRRAEYLLEQTPGKWGWAPGAITALLLPQRPGWARVKFDSGDTLEVELPLESEGDAWRWADAAGSDSHDAMGSPDGGLVAALQNVKKELGPEPTAATSHTFVRATDSGLAAALYSIKKEPAQEPRVANRRVEQHAAATKDSDQAVANLAALAVPAGAIAAAAAAPQRASAVPKHVRPVRGNDQEGDDEVESGEEKDCEPVAKRRKKSATTSEYVGVSWNKNEGAMKSEVRPSAQLRCAPPLVLLRCDTVVAAARCRDGDHHGCQSASRRSAWQHRRSPNERSGRGRRRARRGARARHARPRRPTPPASAG
jgi:hypothetical protein